MDRTSDSPDPTSPNQSAALDKTLMVTIDNDGPDLDSVELEMEFLSTQPLEFEQETLAPEPTPGPSKDTRKVERRAKDREAGSVPSDTSAEAMAMPPLASPRVKSRRPRGRGLLRLKAPPKLTFCCAGNTFVTYFHAALTSLTCNILRVYKHSFYRHFWNYLYNVNHC